MGYVPAKLCGALRTVAQSTAYVVACGKKHARGSRGQVQAEISFHPTFDEKCIVAVEYTRATPYL